MTIKGSEGLPRTLKEAFDVLTSKFTVTRRPVGLADLMNRRSFIRNAMNNYAAELREINPRIEKLCPHIVYSLRVERHYSDDTLGNYGHVWFTLHCDDCEKSWSIG